MENIIIKTPKKRTFFCILFRTLFFCALFVFCMVSGSIAKENKFLIIHLDAVSSVDLFPKLESGMLPNIAEVFSDGIQVKYGLTLYPGGTETICPRLKKGLDNSEHHSIGWGYLERETGKKVGQVSIFLDMFVGFSRQNQHQFLLGLPGLHHLAGVSMLNIERIWETHDFVEFYWFNTDFTGHSMGTEAHFKSLRDFDYYLGLLAKTGKLDGANLVIYSDHGMTTKNINVVKHNEIIPNILGEELLYMAYPNVYLKNSEKKIILAQKLAAHPELDIIVVKSSYDTIRGYTGKGYFEVVKRDSQFQYRYQDEDYFGYEPLGYKGEFLSKEEWLTLTREHLYPGVPPNLFGYLSNSCTGDIITIIDSPNIPYALTAQRGNHAGLKNTDMLVPLLLTGPAFEEYEPFEEFWLYELYTEILPMVDFNCKPRREQHVFTLAYPLRGEMVLSPEYRWRCALACSREGFESMIEFDLYSSFLSRIWVGLGWHQSEFKPHFRVEGFIGDLSLGWLKRPEVAGEFNFSWKLNKQIALNFSKKNIALSIFF